VQTSGHTVTVRYTQSQFQVQIDTSVFLDRCVLNAIVTVPVVKPDSSQMVGLLGSIDGNANNDWMHPDGTVLAETPLGHPQAEYDYCTVNWCIRDPAESLFTYEPGYNHASFSLCDLPYTPGSSLDQVPQEILTICNRNVACIIDAMNANVHMANNANQIRLAAGLASRNGYGGVCTTSDDCHESLQCIDLGGFAGKKCLNELPTCMWDWGDCSIVPCCEGQCVEFASGEKQCRIYPSCQIENGDCTDTDCCDGMQCVDAVGGIGKQCRDLSRCAQEWDDCTAAGCCVGLTCVIEAGTTRCRDLSTCVEEWNDCSLASCCDGLTCVTSDSGSQQCRNTAAPVTTACKVEWMEDCNGFADCCEGLSCVLNDDSKFQCRDLSQCARAYDSCTVLSCCEGLTCKETASGSQCIEATATTTGANAAYEPAAVCATEYDMCDTSPCCDGLTCVDQGWGVQCMLLCGAEWSDCMNQSCCPGLTCFSHSWGGRQCLAM